MKKDKIDLILENRLWNFIFYLVILAFFFFYQFQNTFFVADGPQVFFREWDDSAFQSVLYKMQLCFRSGDFLCAFSQGNYGYGLLFWFLNLLVILPGQILNSEPLMFFMPRLVSTFFGLGGVVLFASSLERLSKSKASNVLLALLILTISVFPFAALRFHNITLLFFLSSLAFFILAHAKSYEDKAITWSFFCIGLAVGVKLNALLSLPTFGLIYLTFFDTRSFFTKRAAKIHILTFFTFFLGFALASQPLLLGGPLFYDRVHNYFGEWAGHLSRARLPVTDAMISENFRSGLVSFYYSWHIVSLWVVIGALCLYKSLRSRKLSLETSAFVGTLIATYYVVFKNGQGQTYTASYFFVVAFVPLIVFLPLLKLRLAPVFLITAASWQVYAHFPQIKQWSVHYQTKWFNETFQRKLSDQREMALEIQRRGGDLSNKMSYCRSSEVLFAVSPIRREGDREIMFVSPAEIPRECESVQFIALQKAEKHLMAKLVQQGQFEEIYEGRETVLFSPNRKHDE